MNKIMVIGCPGSGKSTFSRALSKKQGCKVLHLDYIYHIDNFTQITRTEFKDMVQSFAQNNEQFIIDGNYGATLEWRMQFCDTVILLDFPTDICVKNVLSRMDEEKRDDMAPGFDTSIMDDDFLDFVKRFRTDKLPNIMNLLKTSNMNTVVLQSYEEMNQFLEEIE